MERSRWRRPSPALVVACLALFVALGGTVLAATKINGRTIKVKSLPGNRVAVASLPGNRLKPGTVSGDRLKPGTISGDRLAPNSIKGDKIDTATLGQVPNADHATAADTARHADTATAAAHATDASTVNGRTAGCAEGKREFAGACWDMQPSAAAANLPEAASRCVMVGGELPAGLALLLFTQQAGIQLGVVGEWTNQVTGPDLVHFGSMALEPGGIFQPVAGSAARQYRCVTPLLH